MKPALRCWLLAGALALPGGVLADDPPVPRAGDAKVAPAGETKAAQARELWMKKQTGFDQEKQKIFDLAKSYESSSSPEERAKMKALLREQIDSYYTLRERNRLETIHKLEVQLAELKKNELTRKPRRRQAIIDSWVKQLTVEGK